MALDRLLDQPLIAVIGAGAVGAYYGGRLAQHGQDVHFLLRSDYPAVVQHGWHIRSCDGDFALPLTQFHAYNDARKMPKADLAIVTLKATSNDQYEPLIAPLVKDDTLILTLQNGLGNEDRLAQLFGAERILGGLAFVCINRIGPGRIHHMAQGFVKIGDYQEGRTDRAGRIVELFRSAGIDAHLLQSLKHGRWEKLVWNIPFNGLGAVLDQSTDQVIGHEPGLKLATTLMGEVIAGAKAHGVDLPPDIIGLKIEQTRGMGPYRSSMQVDRQEGRPMEIEAILGEPFRAAQRLGVPTPYLQVLYEMARLIDAAKRT